MIDVKRIKNIVKGNGLKSFRFYTLFIIIIAGFQLNAQKFNEYFVDSTDNSLDVSGFLNSPAGFMPVPLLITEPAVGIGGGMAAVFFHNKKNFINSGGKGQLPPIMTVGAAAYTSNDTWFALAAHQGSYKNDRFRYTGAVGYASVNMGFYGAGILEGEFRFDFNLKSIFTFHEFSFRPIKNIPLFTGFNYLYMGSEVNFLTGIDVPELEVLTENTNSAGMNFIVMWDSRDNSFTPSSGIFTAFDLGRYSKLFGGEVEYSNFANRTYLYIPTLEQKLVGGFRLYAQYKWGDVPFFELPFIQLRGIQAMRYQDNMVGVGETEWRWNVFNRWSLIGFIGAGYTSPKLHEVNFKELKAASGGGFRYLIAKDYGIHAGLDIARGPEVWAWYLTVGSNWFR